MTTIRWASEAAFQEFRCMLVRPFPASLKAVVDLKPIRVLSARVFAWRPRAMHAFIALSLLAACGSDSANFESETSLRADGAKIIVTDSGALDVGSFRFLGYATDTSGANATERIITVAATDLPSVIAVADYPSCSAHLVNVATRSLVRTVGKCGEGPGEVSFLGGVAELRDTFYLYEANRRQILTLDSAGTEIRRDQLLQLLPEGFGSIQWNAMLTPGKYLLTRSAISGADDLPDWKTPVVIVDLNASPISIRALPVGLSRLAIRMTNKFQPPVLPLACIQPSMTGGSGEHIVITQGLTLESVVLNRKLEPTVHTITPAEWMTPIIDSSGALYPAVRRWYVGCGRDLYAIGVRVFDGRDERSIDQRGYVEVRRYDGTLVASSMWSDSNPSVPAIGAPKLLLGDTLVTVSIDSAGWQRVALWEVGK